MLLPARLHRENARRGLRLAAQGVHAGARSLTCARLRLSFALSLAQPMIWDPSTGQAEWEPGPMRTLTVPDRPGGGTLLLNCAWCDFEMEGKFYYDRIQEPDGSVSYRTERLRMEATMEIEGLPSA